MRVPRETKPINWKQFAALDVNALREQLSDGKINLPIKEIASGIADCLPEDEFDLSLIDKNFLKLFNISQILLEYFLKEHHHFKNLSNEYESQRNLAIENSKLRKLLEIHQQAMTYSGPLNNDYMQCPHCPKAFYDVTFLKSHIARRHPDDALSENGMFQLTRKIQEYQKVLFGDNKDLEEMRKQVSHIKAELDKTTDELMAEREERNLLEERIANVVAQKISDLENAMQEKYQEVKEVRQEPIVESPEEESDEDVGSKWKNKMEKIMTTHTKEVYKLGTNIEKLVTHLTENIKAEKPKYETKSEKKSKTIKPSVISATKIPKPKKIATETKVASKPFIEEVCVEEPTKESKKTEKIAKRREVKKAKQSLEKEEISKETNKEVSKREIIKKEERARLQLDTDQLNEASRKVIKVKPKAFAEEEPKEEKKVTKENKTNGVSDKKSKVKKFKEKPLEKQKRAEPDFDKIRSDIFEQLESKLSSYGVPLDVEGIDIATYTKALRLSEKDRNFIAFQNRHDYDFREIRKEVKETIENKAKELYQSVYKEVCDEDDDDTTSESSFEDEEVVSGVSSSSSQESLEEKDEQAINDAIIESELQKMLQPMGSKSGRRLSVDEFDMPLDAVIFIKNRHKEEEKNAEKESDEVEPFSPKRDLSTKAEKFSPPDNSVKRPKPILASPKNERNSKRSNRHISFNEKRIEISPDSSEESDDMQAVDYFYPFEQESGEIKEESDTQKAAFIPSQAEKSTGPAVPVPAQRSSIKSTSDETEISHQFDSSDEDTDSIFEDILSRRPNSANRARLSSVRPSGSQNRVQELTEMIEEQLSKRTQQKPTGSVSVMARSEL